MQILSKEPVVWDKKQRYYIAGALRSNILRVGDNGVKKHLESRNVPEKLQAYIKAVQELPLGQAVKFIYDDANVMGAYAHLDDPNQRLANLYKFLKLCLEFEQSSETSLSRFLAIIENAVYFSESKEDEAFYKSENTNSIELCTIHSTKGLAYPMVLLANTHKSLYSQVNSEFLKHNNFEIEGERKEIVGFKIGDYTPLSHRVLKALDKRKHLAEKKRLLYVALTRAKHHVVLSALLNKTSKGALSLSDDSYLAMVTSSLKNIDAESLFEQTHSGCIDIKMEEPAPKEKKIEYINFTWKQLDFTQKELRTATAMKESADIDMKAAQTGTAVHKAIELHWQNFQENEERVLDKMQVFDENERRKVKQSMQKFYDSSVFKALSNGVKHYFELEFHTESKSGFIDLLYFDKSQNGWVIIDFKTGTKTQEKEDTYQKQLDFYTEVIHEAGYNVVEASLLWV